MFPCNATAATARPTSAMMRVVAPPLQLDGDCCQSSCHFDQALFQPEHISLPGLTLPLHLNGAVQKRKAEFIAGRFCALTALAQLDGEFAVTGDVVIGIGESREPLWPRGFVGSITHTHGYASAIVARDNTVRAIGLDSETWIEQASVDSVSQQILTAGEHYIDHLHSFESSRHYLTFIFSAKESLFKCLFPLVRRYFDFHAAIITPLPTGPAPDGRFHFELLEDLNDEFRAGFRGHGVYTVNENGVHTAVILRL